MPVRFFGPVNNATGYGNAVINFAKAFSRSEIPTKFIIETTEQGRNLLKELDSYNGRTNIDFYLHCPPFSKHQSNAYKIGYFYWEADKLPIQWSTTLNKVNELWVPCKLVKDACLRAGYKGGIKIIPTPYSEFNDKIDITIPSNIDASYSLGENTYKFYSIFQWQNRKNYKLLITSYLKAFTPDDNVVLILKVNTLNNSPNKIAEEINSLKEKLKLHYYPPIYLSTAIVDPAAINGLHQYADCYVSPHHGEGWGMPIHDAMRFKKQIIVTKYGGVTEWLNDESAHIIKHTLGPVTDMEWSNLYGSYQNWAYPSQSHLISLFKDVYLNHKKYEYKTDNAASIAESMSIDAVSKIINLELKGKA